MTNQVIFRLINVASQNFFPYYFLIKRFYYFQFIMKIILRFR